MAVSDYTPLFQAAGKEWNVDPTLLMAMAHQESGGNPGAVSPKGAAGVMQIMPGTQKDLGVTDASDPAQSIFAGAKYMSQMLDKYGSPEKALAAYNAGPGTMDAVLSGKAQMPQETAAYVPAVTAHYQRFAQPQAAPAATPDAKAAALPSDADFLKQTAAGGDSAKPGDDAAFLASTGAKAPAPASPPAAAAPDKPREQTGDTLTDLGKVASDVGTGIKEGFGSQPLGLDPVTENSLVRAGIYPPSEGGGTLLQGANKLVIGGGAALGDAALRAGSAAFRGGQAAVAGGFNFLGMPQLGRDVAAMPEAFMGQPGGLGPAAPANALTAGRGAAVADAAAAPRNALAPGAVDAVRPADVVAPGASPAPNSVGAAASHGEATNMSPAEQNAYRSVAEAQKLMEPQPVGRDTNRYVPGVEPSMAAMEQSANVSREQKMLESAIPEEFKTVAKEHNEARQQLFSQIAGSDVDVQNAIAARSAQADADLKATWANKAPANPQPVLDAAEAIKASPDGRRPVVRSAMDSVTRELSNPDGTPITDPEMLYGVRKHIDDMLSKEAGQDDALSQRAAANLQELKATLDQSIEAAAPGFGAYLKNFTDASRKIDTMQVLQGHESKLLNTQNQMQLSRVQTMMRNIVESRRAPGLNPYKSIPDETVAQLWALRDDLRRSASSDELARAKGSDSVQNALDIAKSAGKMGITALAHGAANVALPVGGSVVLNALGNASKSMGQRKMQRRAADMLRPNALKYPAPRQD